MHLSISQMKATDTFRNPQYGHNCAQAIAYKYAPLYEDKDIVRTYAPYVGGRAPEGLCGALYAAIQAVPSHADEIKGEFTEIVGAARCTQIKQEMRTPCQTCVETADKLVEKYADTSR